MKKFSLMCFLGALLAALCVVGNAQAAVLDVHNPIAAGSYIATADGVLFANDVSVVNVGTGNFDPFLTVHANGNELGYNTSGRNGAQAPLNADSTASREKDYLLANVPLVTINNAQYYEFMVDLNQSGSVGSVSQYISLNQWQLYLAATGGIHTDSTPTDLGGATDLGTLIYSLTSDQLTNGSAITSAWLNAGLTSGSGGGAVDYAVYVPKSIFDAANSSNTFLYLYTDMGNTTYQSNDGFEEWGVRLNDTPPPVPEPVSLALLGLGFGLIGLAKRGKK